MADLQSMDKSAEEARRQFQNMIDSLEGEDAVLHGMQLVIDWIGENYKDAGYKRLCRTLLFDIKNVE